MLHINDLKEIGKTLNTNRLDGFNQDEITKELSLHNGDDCGSYLTKSQILDMLNIPTSCLKEEILNVDMSKIMFEKKKGSKFELEFVFRKDTQDKTVFYSTSRYVDGQLIEQPFVEAKLLFTDTSYMDTYHGLKPDGGYPDPLGAADELTFSLYDFHSCDDDFQFITIVTNCGNMRAKDTYETVLEGAVFYTLGTNLKSMRGMFNSHQEMTYLKNYSTNNSVEDISYMCFSNQKMLELDLFNMSRVKYAYQAFRKCVSLTGNINIPDMGSLRTARRIFQECYNLDGLTINNLASVEDVSYLAMDCRKLEHFELYDYNKGKSNIVYTADDLVGTAPDTNTGMTISVYNRDFGGNIQPTNKTGIVQGCINLKTLKNPISLKGMSIYNIMEMFINCGIEELPYFKMDTTQTSIYDPSNYTNQSFFKNLRRIDLDVYNTSIGGLGTYNFTDGISFKSVANTDAFINYLVANCKHLSPQLKTNLQSLIGNNNPILHDLNDTTNTTPTRDEYVGLPYKPVTTQPLSDAYYNTPSFFQRRSDSKAVINLRSIIQEYINIDGSTSKRYNFKKFTLDENYRKDAVGNSGLITLANCYYNPPVSDLNAGKEGSYSYPFLIIGYGGMLFLDDKIVIYNVGYNRWEDFSMGSGTPGGGSYDDTALRAELKALEDKFKPTNSGKMIISTSNSDIQWVDISTVVPTKHANPSTDEQVLVVDADGSATYKPYTHSVHSTDLDNLKGALNAIVSSNYNLDVTGLKFVDAGNGSYTLTFHKTGLNTSTDLFIDTDIAVLKLPLTKISNVTISGLDVIVNPNMSDATNIVITFTPSAAMDMTKFVINRVYQNIKFDIQANDTSKIEADIATNKLSIVQLGNDVSGKNNDVGLKLVDKSGTQTVYGVNQLSDLKVDGTLWGATQDYHYLNKVTFDNAIQALQDNMDQMIIDFSSCKKEFNHLLLTEMVPGAFRVRFDNPFTDMSMFTAGSTLIAKFSDTSNPGIIRTSLLIVIYDGNEHSANFIVNGTSYVAKVLIDKNHLILSAATSFGTNDFYVKKLGLDYIICIDQTGLTPTDLNGYYKKLETYSKTEADTNFMPNLIDSTATDLDLVVPNKPLGPVNRAQLNLALSAATVSNLPAGMTTYGNGKFLTALRRDAHIQQILTDTKSNSMYIRSADSYSSSSPTTWTPWVRINDNEPKTAWFDNTFKIGVTNNQKEFFPFARLYGTCANIKQGDAGEIMFSEVGYYSIRITIDGLCGGSGGNLAHFKFNFWHGGNKFLSRETNNTVNTAGITYNLNYNFPLNITDINVGLKVEIENLLAAGGFSVDVAGMFLEIEKLF